CETRLERKAGHHSGHLPELTFTPSSWLTLPWCHSSRGGVHTIATRTLRDDQCSIRSVDHPGSGGASPAVCCRNADRDGHDVRVGPAVMREREGGNRGAYPLTDLARLTQRGVAQRDDPLLTAIPVHAVAGSARLVDRIGHSTKSHICRLVEVSRVVVVKEVDITEHDRVRSTIAGREGVQGREILLECRSVEQPGALIVPGLVLESNDIRPEIDNCLLRGKQRVALALPPLIPTRLVTTVEKDAAALCPFAVVERRFRAMHEPRPMAGHRRQRHATGGAHAQLAPLHRRLNRPARGFEDPPRSRAIDVWKHSREF